MNNDLHELFRFLRDHDCVSEAMITTPEGFEYKLEWTDDGNCVVTHTNTHYF